MSTDKNKIIFASMQLAMEAIETAPEDLPEQYKRGVLAKCYGFEWDEWHMADKPIEIVPQVDKDESTNR